MRIPVSAPFPRRWPLTGLTALLVLALVALLLGPTLTQAQNPAPTVTDVAVTSDAGDDDTYLLGDVIHITLTFSEAVNVTGSPRLKIDMDPADWGEKPAAYESGDGTARLTFTHTVVEPNYSTQGIAVLENSLELNGGSIKSAASDTDAELSHDGLDHDANHKVDWRRSPETTPTVSAVSITSDAGDDDTYLLGETIRVTLTFSEAGERDWYAAIEDRHGPRRVGREAGCLRQWQRHKQIGIHPHRCGAQHLHPGHRRAGEQPGTQRRKHQVCVGADRR